MSSNVGLSTPRGSGTSGYVQRNLSNLRPREAFTPYPATIPQHRQRQPNAEILEHDRQRQIEVQVFELRDKLEDDDVEEEEIEARTEALRRKLLSEDVEEGKEGRERGKKGLKVHQVHELAKAKIEESERLRKALGIREDYEEGGYWKGREERMREGVQEQGKGKGEGEVKRERY
ncbi:MAG: hypothetical protein Q9219_001525 [cf. Caloplaca sp. 3 TL-2023]